MTQVFHLYGIKLSGKKKHYNLYDDLKMDQAYVLGLIYELELATNGLIEDDDAYGIQAPAQIVQKLLRK